PDGRRPAIRMGKVSLRIAEDIKTKVQQLADAHRYNQPVEGKLAKWVADLELPLAKKLARVGLILDPEPKTPTTLGAFLKSYIDGRVDLKPATKVVRGQVIRDLNAFFGETRDVRTIT